MIHAPGDATTIAECKVLLTGNLDPPIRLADGRKTCRRWNNLIVIPREYIRMLWDVSPNVKVTGSVQQCMPCVELERIPTHEPDSSFRWPYSHQVAKGKNVV